MIPRHLSFCIFVCLLLYLYYHLLTRLFQGCKGNIRLTYSYLHVPFTILIVYIEGVKLNKSYSLKVLNTHCLTSVSQRNGIKIFVDANGDPIDIHTGGRRGL